MKSSVRLYLFLLVVPLILSGYAHGDDITPKSREWLNHGMHVAQQYPNTQTGIAGILRFVYPLPDGPLLVGSTLGAYIYDGCRWQRLPQVPMAYSMLQTHDGKILIGSGGKVLELCKTAENAYDVRTRVKLDGEENQLEFLGEEPSGGLVGCFGNGLLRQLSATQISPNPLPAPYGRWILGLVCLDSGTFIAVSNEASDLLKITPTTGQPEEVPSEIFHNLGARRIIGLKSDSASNCWVLTDDGTTFGFDGHSLRPAPWHLNAPSLHLRPSCILRLQDGNILVGSAANGLSLFDHQGQLLTRIDINNGMPEDLVVSAAQDRNGGLWIVTTKSLLRFDSRLRFLDFGTRQGLTVQECESVTRYHDRLYVGGVDGLFVQNTEAKSQAEAFIRVPGVISTHSILVSDDTLWIGDNTLRAIHGDGPLVSYPTTGIGSILAPRARKDLLICGTASGFTILRKTNGSWSVEASLPTAGRLIYSMGELHDNDYWAQLGTAHVARLQEVKGHWEVTIFGPEAGLPDRWIDLGIIDGKLLVPFEPDLHFGAGMWDEAQGRFIPTADFTFYADNLGPHVYHPIYYRSTGEPLIRANSRNAELTPRISKLALSAVQNVAGSREECAFGAYQDPDGSTWICHAGGILRCSPPLEGLQQNVAEDCLLIRELVDLRNNRLLAANIRESQSLVLDPDQNWIHVQTALVEFRSEQHALYKIWMEGFDALPTGQKYLPGFEATPDRRLWSFVTDRDFTNLPSGHYTLHVEALDGMGMKLRSLSIAITIRTPWYASWPAKTSYGLALLACIFGIIRVRERVLRSSNERLSTMVASRTEELRDKNQSLQLSLIHVEKLAGDARESELRFRRMANKAPAMIWLSDAVGGWIFANETWRRHTGQDDGQSLRDGWQMAVHPEDVPALVQLHKQAHAHRSGYASEFRLLTPAGHFRTMSIVAHPFHSEEDAFNGLIGICLDITEVKKAQEERVLIERSLQQSQRLESLGVLAGGIAHDFNNLLTVVMGNASVLELEEGREPTERDMLNQILEASRSAAELCRQMLAYAGHGRYHVRPLDALAIARVTLDHLRTQLDGRLDLVLEAEPDLPQVRADEPQFCQLLTNLLSNAIEALEGCPGRISIRLGLHSSAIPGPGELIYAHTQLPPKMLLLEIIDDGPGIATENFRRIFEPFFTTKELGRGLGLSAALGIVKSHSGVLRLEARPGKGCHFWILLPYENTQVEKADSPSAEASKHCQGRVLLVDDEEAVRTSLSRLLVSLGFQCDQAQDGMSALELFNGKTAYDLVVLDLVMTGLGGREVMQRMLHQRPSQNVLLVSGYNVLETDASLLQGETTAFLQKPFEMHELKDKIWSLLQKGRIGRVSPEGGTP